MSSQTMASLVRRDASGKPEMARGSKPMRLARAARPSVLVLASVWCNDDDGGASTTASVAPLDFLMLFNFPPLVQVSLLARLALWADGALDVADVVWTRLTLPLPLRRGSVSFDSELVTARKA